MKHIESIQPEYAADDMTALLLTDATASAALSRLLHDWTGCAIPPLADHPESEVEELVPLCLSILRRHWTTPLTALGDGTTPMSLADLFRQSIGDRVQGNEAWSIPPVHANLPTALAQLRQRDMSSGLTLTLTDSTTTSLPDGLSLAQLLCTGLADNITELKDENVGWTMTKAVACFENIIRMKLNCRIAHCPCIACYDNYAGNYNEHLKILELPLLEEMQYYTTKTSNMTMGIIIGTEIEELYLPELHTVRYADDCRNRYDYLYIARGEKLRKVMAPKLSSAINNNAANGPMSQCPMLNTFIAPLYTGVFTRIFKDCPQLIHVEVDFNGSRNLDSWNPTMALRTDTTAEDYVDLREDMSFANNLEQFLYNFQTYIADRAIDSTGQSALTLTLSAEVYAALEAQDGQTILATLTNKNWTVTTA